jgi:hypothetical protein
VQVFQEHSMSRDLVGQESANSLGGIDHEHGMELNEYGMKR